MQTNTPMPRQSRRRQVKSGHKKRGTVLLMLALGAALAVFILIGISLGGKTGLSGGVTAGLEVAETETDVDNAYQGLRISEAMSSNKTSYADENGAFGDWIEIWNDTGHDVNLANVGVSDRSTSIRFLFPSITLKADGRVVVFCDDTNVTDVTKAFHAKFKISSLGEDIYLFAPSGNVIDHMTVPILASDTVYTLRADGSYAESEQFTPNYPNTEEGYAAFRAAYAVQTGVLVINEVMADGKTLLADEDGEYSDWVEIYNSGDEVIDLSRYALSDDETKPLKWRFPAGASIGPRGYYLVFCSGKDRAVETGGIPHTNFRISAEKETIVLSNGLGQMVDRVAIDNLPTDCSWGRNKNGEWELFRLATPGIANDEYGQNSADYTIRAQNPTGVIITEVMSCNSSLQLYSSGDSYDWVELTNTSSNTVELSGYGLSDNIKRPRKWQFPQGTTIAPGECMIIFLAGGTETYISNHLNTSFSIKSAGGETLTFSDPTGKVLDKLYIPYIPADTSYGRTIGVNGFRFYDASTPGTANTSGYAGYSEVPTIDVSGGLYRSAVTVTISAKNNARIYYTIDGSIPSPMNGALYTEPLRFNNVVSLRARAYEDGLQPSRVVTETYFVATYHTLPVVSITADPDLLFNEEYGILADGKDIDKTTNIPWKNSVYRKQKNAGVRVEGNVEMYLADGTKMLSQGMEFRLLGQYSLDMPQKSMKIIAKAKYGSKYFNAKLFDDREYTEYKSFVLRNSGNDSLWTRVQDGVQSRLIDQIEDTTVIHQAWRPVIVYLNGEYYGEYNLRECVSRYFVAQHEGLSLEEADNMTILEANWKVNYGDNTEYKEMIAEIKKLDPANKPEDLQYILDRVDVDNYFDYIIFEMFFGNTDGGNIRYYKLDGEGQKWRWILYDLDYGLWHSKNGGPSEMFNSKGFGSNNDINNTILLKLMTNSEMRDKFFTRTGELLQTVFTTENMLATLEPMIAQLDPEMYMHCERWAPYIVKTIAADAPTNAQGLYNYWKERVNRLRNVMKWRPYIFWHMMQDYFKLSDSQMVSYFGECPPENK